MKTLEFLFQDNQIHFALGNEGEVMINATEMAKIYNKRVDHFTKTEHAKAFIQVMEKNIIQPPNGGRIIDNRGRNGIYFDQRLALKFAAWLDPEFEFWVYSTINTMLFGNYKQHWEAHAQQEIAKVAMEGLKTEILKSPTTESVALYFQHEREFKEANNAKKRAIRNQLKMFN